MPIRVFLSHQQRDAATAAVIAGRLRMYHQIDSYLDVIDPALNRSGEDLASYLRQQMATCSQLLAVTSSSTRLSQWVPWEIGVASEKDFPLATYADYQDAVPEFLRAWPYLRTLADIDSYAAASKAAERRYTARRYLSEGEVLAKRAGASTFFTNLRSALRQ